MRRPAAKATRWGACGEFYLALAPFRAAPTETQRRLLRAALIMVTFALGVSTIILALGYGAQSAIRSRQALMRRIATVARPLMGAVFVAVGLAILFKLHHLIEFWALENLPPWLIDFSVSI